MSWIVLSRGLHAQGGSDLRVGNVLHCTYCIIKVKVIAGNSGNRVISETSKYLAVYQLNGSKLSYEMTSP